MTWKRINSFGLLVFLLSFWLTFSANAAPDEPKSLSPNDPRLKFAFRVKPGQEPLSFKVKLDATGTISGVSVFRHGESQPLQTLPRCSKFPDHVNEFWESYEISKLVAHADLNFDGFEDLELLQNYIPHLGKGTYCIFLWDSKVGRFIQSPELSYIAGNLEAHPNNKTLSVHEDWQGGPWEESTYRWKNGKLELIEQDGLYGDWSLPKSEDQKCGFQFTCSKLIKGKLVPTLEKWICTPNEMENLPECPGTTAIPTQNPTSR
jgi:hypothetical protein